MISVLPWWGVDCTVKWDLSKSGVWSTRWKMKHHTLQILILVTQRFVSMKVARQPKKEVWAFHKRYEAAARGEFARQRQQRPLWNRALEFKAGQVGKEEKKKMIEVHLKFYTLMFICVIFLEGEAWTAEGLANIPPYSKNRNVVQSVTQCY